MLLVAGSSLVGVSSSNILVIMQNCAPHGEVGSWIGFGNFVGNLGGVLSPFVTGVLISWTGSYFPGFALAPLVLVVGILPFWFIVQDLDSGNGEIAGRSAHDVRNPARSVRGRTRRGAPLSR